MFDEDFKRIILIDVSYKGPLFNSCELEFQFGEQSSVVSRASSKNEALCNSLKKEIGKVLEVKYKKNIFAAIKTITIYIIEE